MRNPYTLSIVLGLMLMALLVWLILADTPIASALGLRSAEPEVTPSPWYWHRLDEQHPREYTAHYITYEEAMSNVSNEQAP